jgi:hypothetical protein
LHKGSPAATLEPVWKKLLPFTKKLLPSGSEKQCCPPSRGPLGTLPLKYGMSKIPCCGQAALSNYEGKLQNKNLWTSHKIHISKKS